MQRRWVMELQFSRVLVFSDGNSDAKAGVFMCTCSFQIILTLLSIRWTSQQSVRSCWMTRILSWNSLRYAVRCFFCQFLHCWLCLCFFFVLRAFIWSFGLTKSFLPPSLLSCFLVHFTRITISVSLLFSSYNHNIIYLCLFQINPVQVCIMNYCFDIVLPFYTFRKSHLENLILLVGTVNRTCEFLLSEIRCTWKKFLATWHAICLYRGGPKEKKWPEAH